jgi:hypothetical protein
MYGRIQRCDDFILLALCDYCAIFIAVFGDFSSSILRVFSLDFFEGIMSECLVPLCG